MEEATIEKKAKPRSAKSDKLIDFVVNKGSDFLTIGTASKVVFGSNCASNRKKVKAHIQKAIKLLERCYGKMVYPIYHDENQRVIVGYKVAVSEEEKMMYTEDLARRKAKALSYGKSYHQARKNIEQACLPLPSESEVDLIADRKLIESESFTRKRGSADSSEPTL